MAPQSQTLSTVSDLGEIPVLHLDGRVLRSAFESMASCAEKLGGMELLTEGVIGKSLLFQRTFVDSQSPLVKSEFLDCCAFMPTVRRRLKSVFQQYDFDYIADAIKNLLHDISLEKVDDRINQFTETLVVGKKGRWARDMAAEILHYREPEVYPLMTRWVWDYAANTGILREIWYCENQLNRLEIPDGVRTHLELRRELDEFLTDCGVYSNRPIVTDILFAWLYSEYIGSQGGSFLKAQFSYTGTPFGYALRMLGLDASTEENGKTRLLMPDGKRYRLSATIEAVSH